jgi:hypothetical protein
LAKGSSELGLKEWDISRRVGRELIVTADARDEVVAVRAKDVDIICNITCKSLQTWFSGMLGNSFDLEADFTPAGVRFEVTGSVVVTAQPFEFITNPIIVSI